MSNPSFSNIDRWLFELMEGNLSPEQEAQLEAFLLQHPEFDIDKDMWEMAKLDEEAAVYNDKNNLYKPRPLVPLWLVGTFAAIAVTAFSLVFFISESSKGSSVGAESSVVNRNLRSDYVAKATINPMHNQQKEKQLQIVNTTLPISIQSLAVENQRLAFQPHSLDFTAVQDYNQDISSSSHTTEQEIAENTDASLPPLETVMVYETTETDKNIVQSNSSVEANSKDQHINTEESKGEQSESKVTSKSATKKSLPSLKKPLGHVSFQSIGRELQGMVNKPEGLRNIKDPWAFAPGLQGLDVNNGSVGEFLATRAQASTRLQWMGTGGQQLMNQFSIDGYSYGVRGGLGMQVKHRQYGIGGIQHIDVAMMYSPKISLTKNLVIEPSVKFNMGNKRLNDQFMKAGQLVEYDRMNMEQYYVEGADPYGRNLWYRDIGAGLLLNTRWFYAGIQVDNLLQNHQDVLNYQFDQLALAPRHMIASFGGDYQTKKKHMAASPYLIYQRFNALEEYWMGSSFRFHWMTAGVSFSNNREMAAMLGVKFDRFMITYSADYIQSQMLNKRLLSHQLTLRLLSKPCSMGKRLIH
jgi:type IX secretion system PorP/SprF family membrane protein